MEQERTVLLMKPDGVRRGLIGNVLTRLENKGLKVIGLKMMTVEDALVQEHYGHHADKPFFKTLKAYIQSAPIVAVCIEGIEAVKVVRALAGDTSGRKADIGTIRGDLCMSVQTNIVHSSGNPEEAEVEIKRFFKDDELFDYSKGNENLIYAEDEKDYRD
ncbi:nucleoside-diphosphate kinase [Patescibacteria group bacterium]